jgi:hypothetical protein
MKIKFAHILAALLLVIGLIAANVYQYQNPKVVEVPAKQTAIDSTAWVKQSAYVTRGMIIDSLKKKNEKLAEQVRQSKDKIANYTSITGKLKLKVDSLEDQKPVRIDSFFTYSKPEEKAIDLSLKDTTVTFNRSFSDGLFKVQSDVVFEWPYLDNKISLSQERDIKIDVVNTFNTDRSRLLTYVTSPDFDSLKYQTYTELEPKNRLPKFWIGAGAGVAATLTGIIILR